MNESNKHAVWVLGLAGSITLVQWNTIVGIACGVAGFIAACLSIYSWFEKRRRRREKDEIEKAESRNEQSKRKHHRRNWLLIWLVLSGLLLWVTALYAQPGDRTSQTNGTDGAEVGGQRSDVGGQPLNGVSPQPSPGFQPPSPAPAGEGIWAATVAEDARKLVYDVLSGFSWAGFVQAIFVAYLGAKGLRNHTRLGNMKVIGDLLRWINLEATSESRTSASQKAESRNGEAKP